MGLPRLSYQSSSYSGERQHLLVSFSRHFYKLKSGVITYQEKAIETTWSKVIQLNQALPKDILVHFLIKDDFSGVFYCESYPVSKLSSIESFLFRAWRKKRACRFHGYPESFVIARNVFEAFPYLKIFLRNRGINYELPSSGFAVGVESIRNWERNLRIWFTHKTKTVVMQFPHYTRYFDYFNNEMNASYHYDGKDTRNEKWEHGLHIRPKPLTTPSNFSDFVLLFDDPNHPDDYCSLDLLNYPVENEFTEIAKYKPIDDVERRKSQKEFKNKRNEIKKRTGFRYLKELEYIKNYHVVYNTQEANGDQTKGPWFVECEDHKTRLYRLTVKEAIETVTHGINWCEQCISNFKTTQKGYLDEYHFSLE